MSSTSIAASSSCTDKSDPATPSPPPPHSAATPPTSSYHHPTPFNAVLSSFLGGGGSETKPPRRIAIYALPFVALAEERARQLEHVCAELPEVQVNCLAGGAPLLLLEDRLSDQHVVYVCTNEKAHALWRELESRQRLAEVAVVVVDEVHYLSDGSRGYVLELFLTSVIRYASSSATSTLCSPITTTSSSSSISNESGSGERDAVVMGGEETLLTIHQHQISRLQLIVTSATIANPQTIAKWCGNAFLFLTNHRPVPLQSYFVLQARVYDSKQQVVRELMPELESDREKKSRLLLQSNQPHEEGMRMGRSRSTTLLHHRLALLPRHEEEELALLLAMEGYTQQFQVLIFTPTRKEAELTARRLATAVACRRGDGGEEVQQEKCSGREEEDADLLSSLPHKAPAVSLVEFRDSAPEVKEGLQFTTQYGSVGFHHAGLGSRDRAQLENAYRQGVFWALCCTTTLSTGMNLPCRRVIFTAPRIGIAPLDTLTFMQAAGRAGRVGLDPYGEAFVIGKPMERPLLRQLADNQLPPIESNFAPERRGVARVLLDGMASCASCVISRHQEKDGGVQDVAGESLGPHEVHQVLLGTLYAVVEQEKLQPDSEYAYYAEIFKPGCSFIPPLKNPLTMGEQGKKGSTTTTAEYNHTRFPPALFQATKEALILLETHLFIIFKHQRFSLTPLGLATASSLFSPEDALLVLQDLQRSARQFCLADDLHLLYHCTPLQHDIEPDWHQFYHTWGPLLFQGPTVPIVASVVEVEERTLAGFAMAPPPRRSKHPVVMRCRRLYGALILAETVREHAPSDVARKFGLQGGAVEVHRLMEAAALFASSLSRFAYTLNWWYLPPLFNIMVVRLRRGVAPDLLPLMEIEGLTPWRARELFERGYRTVRSVVGATPAELEAVFAKHSLYAFQLRGEAPHDGEYAVGEGEEDEERSLWCRGNDHKEVVRQLQHRAKLVLWREAKDLEAILLDGHRSGPPPLQMEMEKDQRSGPTSRPGSRTIKANGPPPEAKPNGESKPCLSPHTSSPSVTVCMVKADDPAQVDRFQHHFQSLVCSAAGSSSRRVRETENNNNKKNNNKEGGGAGGTSSHHYHHPFSPSDIFVSIRAVPEDNLVGEGSSCGGVVGPSLTTSSTNHQKRRATSFFTLILGVQHSPMQCEEHQGVVFVLSHCPSRRHYRAERENTGDVAIYEWWRRWLRDVVSSPSLHCVWLGLQQQVRFLSRMGWLRPDALCSHFESYPSHLTNVEEGRRRKGGGEEKDEMGNTCPCAGSVRPPVHDPIVALWLLHPEIDTSGVFHGYQSSASVLVTLLRIFPCPVAQNYLLLGSDSVLSLLKKSPRYRVTSASSSRKVVVTSIMDISEGTFATANAGMLFGVQPAADTASYTSRGHQEAMGSLAAAALLVPLLHLLDHEDLYESYALREMWIPLICAQMELAGVGFDLSLYPPLMQAMQTKVHELTACAYEVVGRSNWSLTSPRDCAVALYDDLRLPCLHFLGDLNHQHGAPLPRRRRLLRENRSTKASVLVQLARMYPHNPLPALLIEFRRLEGWSEKYMDPLQRAAAGQAPPPGSTSITASSSSSALLRPNGRKVRFSRVHGQIFTTATATGRLAMSEPSLQTIPHPVSFELHGNTVEVNLRRALIPLPSRLHVGEATADEKDDDGEDSYIYISADYSHIEARLLAHFSQDEALLSSFPQDLRDVSEENTTARDIFTELAADLYHKRLNGVDENDDDGRSGVTPEERRIAKSIWYGMMYGRGKNSLANELYLSVEAAEGFLRQLRGKYSMTMACMARMAAEAEERGFVRTLLGRKRWIPKMSQAKTPRPDREIGVPKGWNTFQRVAINTLCQASAADVMKEAMVRIARDPLFQGGEVRPIPSSGTTTASPPVARLVLQVHDELLFEVKRRDKERVIKALRNHMDLAHDLHLRVPLVINFQCGTSWGDMVRI